MNYSGKIVILWTVFLLGTLFHTQLGLMPLFHGISVAHENAGNVTAILWLMLAFFALPLFAMTGIAFTDHRTFRVGHFWLTVVYSVLNFLHVVMDLGVQPIVWSQIALMMILFGVGVLLNLVSYQWVHYQRSHFPSPHLIHTR